ncbi:ATP-binding protein [Streptomyces griseorubiginosus]|uniref:ATP-binding protein n=1 Tax=Streptomyces griseorubiginosus TaxID=67304 RepID=UPI002E816C71|nr:ATP-binding protein [Streptomyces griseorubiginosus]WUB42208.1 ATP-binding protein [Streptomyces griseorubiginosus]WUB50727.1 ATP-binding protein [Streptomyces griseorubiginosus]
MSSPAKHVLRPPIEAVPEAGDAGTAGEPPRRPDPVGARRPPSGGPLVSAALLVACSGEGFARARAFTRETLGGWSIGHRSDDATLVITELAANAVAHAVLRPADGAAEVWLGLSLGPSHLLVTVSDPGDEPPAYTPTDDCSLREHGRGLYIVDALAEEWGWTSRPPAGKTVWAKLSTTPPP